MNQEFYNHDEVQQIVKRAVAIQESDLVPAHQLAQIAAELGIAPATLERAREQWQAEQSRRGRWRTFLRSRRGLCGHLWAYVGGSALLGLNIHYSEMNPAFWYIPALWAGALLCHVREVVTAHRDTRKPSLHITALTTATTAPSARSPLQRG